MFFLFRAAVCIGIVFCLVPDSGGSRSLQTLAADTGRLAVREAGTYCAADEQCTRAGLDLAAGAIDGSNGPPVSAEHRRVAVPAPPLIDPAAHPAKFMVRTRS